uniref:Retinoic acid receptor responder protein 2 n=1 Tax=Denticeps clupeoides TaxID=299321 RepID=A0AAY4DUJ5_9TELE
MALVFLVLLLGAGTLLSSTDADEAYSKLPETFKKGVDLAVQQVNSHANIKQPFNFFKSLDSSEGSFSVKFIYHNFYLKATTCAKGTSNLNQCPFRNDRPLIDCTVCYKMYGQNIEVEPKPFVHCVHKPSINLEVRTKRINHCNHMIYLTGSPTIFAVKSPE